MAVVVTLLEMLLHGFWVLVEGINTPMKRKMTKYLLNYGVFSL